MQAGSFRLRQGFGEIAVAFANIAARAIEPRHAVWTRR
jgi:hypothetical protein